MPDQPILPRCPECGGLMAVRMGERELFLGCQRFPDCRGTRRYAPPPPPPISASVAEATLAAARAASELAVREDWIACYPDATSEIMACAWGRPWMVLRLRLTAGREPGSAGARWCRKMLAEAK